MNAPEEYLDLAAVADLLDVSTKTVRRRITSGELRAVRFGKGQRAPLRVRRSDVDRAMRPVRSAK